MVLLLFFCSPKLDKRACAEDRTTHHKGFFEDEYELFSIDLCAFCTTKEKKSLNSTVSNCWSVFVCQGHTQSITCEIE